MPRPPAERDESNKPDGSDSPDENDAGVNFEKEKAERQDYLVSKLKELQQYSKTVPMS